MDPLGYPVLGRAVRVGVRTEVVTRAAISWSGGKDSLAAARRHARAISTSSPRCTMFDESGARSRSHGLRPELIAAQASRLGLRAVSACCSWSTYNESFAGRAAGSSPRDGITHVVFGDLVFAEHRAWAEARCAEAGLVAVEPLFGRPTGELFDAFVASGATALMVTIREPWLDETWLGRALGAEMKTVFAERGIDPCGERGEYHTAVVDGAAFLATGRRTLRRARQARRLRRTRSHSMLDSHRPLVRV